MSAVRDIIAKRVAAAKAEGRAEAFEEASKRCFEIERVHITAAGTAAAHHCGLAIGGLANLDRKKATGTDGTG